MIKSKTNILQSKTKTTPDEARSMRGVLSYVPKSFDNIAESDKKKKDIEEIFDKGKKKKTSKK